MMRPVLDSAISYKSLFSAYLQGDKSILLSFENSESDIPYSINATDKFLRIIDEKLRFLEDAERIAEVKLGYQASLDGYA